MTKLGFSQLMEVEGFQDPALLHAAIADPRSSWVWLVLRVSIGCFLLDAGWRQMQQTAGTDNLSSIGLTLAAIALILGAFAAFSAFVGGSLAVLSGASSGLVGLALLGAVVWFVLAWKTVGWIGLDRWLLPSLGMPWRGGALIGRIGSGNKEFTLGGRPSGKAEVR